MKSKEQKCQESTFRRDFERLWAQVGLTWGPCKKGQNARVMEQNWQHPEVENLS